jgi:alkylated DNA repair dioxygenase AlkB
MTQLNFNLQHIELSSSAYLTYVPGWVEASQGIAYLEVMMTQLPWESHTIRLFGKDHPEPRLSCWMGEPWASYRYSGKVRTPKPWTPEVTELRDRLNLQFGVQMNAALANLYRTGQDGMGWHSDDEFELGIDPVIASVSLGQARRFCLRNKVDRRRKYELTLSHGDLLIMGGRVQRDWQHGLPKTTRRCDARVNLTYRALRAPNASRIALSGVE